MSPPTATTGPNPNSWKARIVFFADSVEAASRSLRKVTPQNIEELVDSIFEDRIRDGQLDECPITYAQVAAIKKQLQLHPAQFAPCENRLPESR